MGSRHHPVIIAVILLLFPVFSYATSGACSYHGGVDCSAGAGSYGQVICNDGWDGSSVSYSSMIECNQPSLSDLCPAPLIIGCTEQSEVQQWTTLCSQEQGSLRAEQAMSGLLGSSFSTSVPEACTTAQSCQTELDLYNKEKTDYDACVAKQFSNLNAENQLLDAQSQQLSISTCQMQHGSNSTYDTTKYQCVCQLGYWLDPSNSQCELPATVCANTLGQYAHPISDRCVCNDGFNGSSGTCVDARPIRYITQQALDWAKNNQNCKLDASLNPDELQECFTYESNTDKFNWQVSAAATPTSASTENSGSSQAADTAPVSVPTPGKLDALLVNSTYKAPAATHPHSKPTKAPTQIMQATSAVPAIETSSATTSQAHIDIPVTKPATRSALGRAYLFLRHLFGF